MKCEAWIIDWLPARGAHVPMVFVGMQTTTREGYNILLLEKPRQT
jgi:hypothetical protein